VSTRREATEEQAIRQILDRIEADEEVSQRDLADELGVALGMVNAYIKRCVRTGLIKIQQAPPRRYRYYLTPQGFAEKSRLTAEYLTVSFNFFRGARAQCTAILDQCEAQGWRRIALAGASELSEIAALCAQDHAVEIAGVVDDRIDAASFAGMPTARHLEELGAISAVVVCDMRTPQAVFDALVESLPRERVLTPPLLRISRTRPTFAE